MRGRLSVNEKMTAIANAIRSKTGETSPLNLDGMVEAINGISSSADSLISVTRFASGTYKGSVKTINNVVIDSIGFKPIVFLLRNDGSIHSDSSDSPYFLLGAAFVYKPDGTYYANYTQFILKSQRISDGFYAQGGKSDGNIFVPTDTGVKGSSGSTAVKMADANYYWFAWG